MLAAASDASLISLQELPENAGKLCGLCLGSDHIGANKKLIAHVEDTAPPNWVIWPGLCKQHASGLITAPAVEELALVSPGFCAANKFKHDTF